MQETLPGERYDKQKPANAASQVVAEPRPIAHPPRHFPDTIPHRSHTVFGREQH
jgi:hypothetical protein